MAACPGAGLGVGPAPTAAASAARWPHRQTGLVRARSPGGERGPCPQLLKGFFVAGGLAVGSCPARGTHSPGFVPPCCPCPDLGSAGQRPLSAGAWGRPAGAALGPQCAWDGCGLHCQGPGPPRPTTDLPWRGHGAKPWHSSSDNEKTGRHTSHATPGSSGPPCQPCAVPAHFRDEETEALRGNLPPVA